MVGGAFDPDDFTPPAVTFDNPRKRLTAPPSTDPRLPDGLTA
jgi:hypothetical protein